MPPSKPLTAAAEKRLKVLQSLDSLGAGFTLASHDLDIRGAGNLLGEEQSGHIKEVGFELYQTMLEEAVASLRSGDKEVLEEGGWSPQINIGTAVLIPEGFIPDLQVRLGIYRRLADVATQGDLDGFAAELADRFGRLPEEVRHLLEVVAIKLHVPRRQCGEHRCRAEGSPDRPAGRSFRQSAGSGPVDHRPRVAGQAPPGYENRDHARLGYARAAAQGRATDHGRSRQARHSVRRPWVEKSSNVAELPHFLLNFSNTSFNFVPRGV